MQFRSSCNFVQVVDDDALVYASRCLDQPKALGKAVLSDFGSAVRGDEKQNHDV
jgi:serine/threonine-protein kinase SRPK3